MIILTALIIASITAVVFLLMKRAPGGLVAVSASGDTVSTAEPFYITYEVAAGHYRPVSGVTELIQKHNEPIEEMKRMAVAHTGVFLDGAREHVRTGAESGSEGQRDF